MSERAGLDESNGQEQQNSSPVAVLVDVVAETEISDAELLALERLLGDDLLHLINS